MTQCPPEAGQHETAGMRRIASGYGQPGGRVKLTGCGRPTTRSDTPSQIPATARSCGKDRKVVSVPGARLGITESPGATLHRRERGGEGRCPPLVIHTCG